MFFGHEALWRTLPRANLDALLKVISKVLLGGHMLADSLVLVQNSPTVVYLVRGLGNA